ncbi:MAG: hypothetical protein JWM57_4225 [Phycisphaerales bacterium]|nr:hypothetical protein [Phycisphaerales bacterium]
MPRKKTTAAAAAPADTPTESTNATLEPSTQAAAETANETAATGGPVDGPGKNYGPPYKAIFTSAEKEFELGEDRRFKQRVFTFKDRPADDVIAALKENGFTYRAAEKAWTVPATAESRVVTDRLARQFAGAESSMGRG